MRGISCFIFLLLASMSAHTFPADWKIIGNDDLFLVALNHDSVQVIPLGSRPTLYLFRWLRAYHEPKALLHGKPLVKYHVFGVTVTCDSAPNAFVTFEDTRTEAFDVIASMESEKFPFSDDVREISSMPGMKSVRAYVCSNQKLWTSKSTSDNKRTQP